MPMIKIMLVEDHLVVRNGIKMLLDTQTDLEVIGEADNGVELLDRLDPNNLPDIVLSDINMPLLGGIELTEKIHELYPEINVILLSMINSSQQVIHAFAKGVRGYLVKNVSYEELIYSIHHVQRGGKYLCEELAMLLIGLLSHQPDVKNPNHQLINELDLSDRETEVLQLISEGYTNLEIADLLFLSKRTVEGHRQNLIDKTKTKNTAALIKFAVQHQLVK
jgi:DNA-binding NarL/FixJ family response regulator